MKNEGFFDAIDYAKPSNEAVLEVFAMTTMESRLLSTAELLAMPDDGMDRDLSRGRLREQSAALRGRREARVLEKITTFISDWNNVQRNPKGDVLMGGAGFQLGHDPDTAVWADLAYISAETAKANPEDAFLIDGIPVLAVEILSPSDKQETIVEKVRDYLDAGVPLVWVVEPVFKTITVYRPGEVPALYTVGQLITGDEHLPGFEARVCAVFGN